MEIAFRCEIGRTNHVIVEMFKDNITLDDLVEIFEKGKKRLNNRGPGYIYTYAPYECVAIVYPCHYLVITAYKLKTRGKKQKRSGKIGQKPSRKLKESKMNSTFERKEIQGKCLLCKSGHLQLKPHPFRITDEILGEFDAYVCDACGEAFFTEKSSNEIESLLHTRFAHNNILTAEDISLLLLYANPDTPVRGAVSFMKQVFLFLNEIAKKFKLPVEDLCFIPFHYGPYSYSVDEAWGNLEEQGFLHRYGRKSTRKETFEILKDGFRRGKRLYNSLPEEVREELLQRRRDWHELGHDGILKFVYQNYPEFTGKSKIKYKIFPRRKSRYLHGRA